MLVAWGQHVGVLERAVRHHTARDLGSQFPCLLGSIAEKDNVQCCESMTVSSLPGS